MSTGEHGRSPELDQLRQMLFPELPPEEGWAQVEAAISGASDAERWNRIEQLVAEQQVADDLNADLLAVLRQLRQEQVDKEPE
jgi:hypothetical protein